MRTTCAYCSHVLTGDRFPLECPGCGRPLRRLVEPTIKESRAGLDHAHARVFNSMMAIEDVRFLRTIERATGEPLTRRTGVNLLALEGLL